MQNIAKVACASATVIILTAFIIVKFQQPTITNELDDWDVYRNNALGIAFSHPFTVLNGDSWTTSRTYFSDAYGYRVVFRSPQRGEELTFSKNIPMDFHGSASHLIAPTIVKTRSGIDYYRTTSETPDGKVVVLAYAAHDHLSCWLMSTSAMPPERAQNQIMMFDKILESLDVQCTG